MASYGSAGRPALRRCRLVHAPPLPPPPPTASPFSSFHHFPFFFCVCVCAISGGIHAVIRTTLCCFFCGNSYTRSATWSGF